MLKGECNFMRSCVTVSANQIWNANTERQWNMYRVQSSNILSLLLTQWWRITQPIIHYQELLSSSRIMWSHFLGTFTRQSSLLTSNIYFIFILKKCHFTLTLWVSQQMKKHCSPHYLRLSSALVTAMAGYSDKKSLYFLNA